MLGQIGPSHKAAEEMLNVKMIEGSLGFRELVCTAKFDPGDFKTLETKDGKVTEQRSGRPSERPSDRIDTRVFFGNDRSTIDDLVTAFEKTELNQVSAWVRNQCDTSLRRKTGAGSTLVLELVENGRGPQVALNELVVVVLLSKDIMHGDSKSDGEYDRVREIGVTRVISSEIGTPAHTFKMRIGDMIVVTGVGQRVRHVSTEAANRRPGGRTYVLSILYEYV